MPTFGRAKGTKVAPVHESAPTRRGLHKDWRTWVAVAVLLLAAVAYVLNLDRVIVPSGSGAPVPAVSGATGR
jgi:hypothetical protein